MHKADPQIILDGSALVLGLARWVPRCLQGNMDPGVLFGSKAAIEQRVIDTVKAAQGTRHVMNLGHGVLVGTPEENVAHFFEVAKTVHQRM